MIETRVCIDDMLGPFDCKLNPAVRWNGWLSPHFSLAVARQLSAQTIREADEYGYDCVATIHVIEGREDSPDTVHVIEGGPSRHGEDDETLAVAVRVNWRQVSRDARSAATVGEATPQARKAARRRKPGGRGAHRAVIVHIRWMYLDEGSDTAVSIEAPDDEGLYPIGGWEWTWHLATWWCLCGEPQHWHEPDCPCGVTRAQMLALKEATPQVGAILRRLAPGATAALIETIDAPRIIAVTEGATELPLGDGGPYDTETLGEADAALRAALGSNPIEGGPHWLAFPPIAP
ncbi:MULTISPECIES: hypothetical protein [unclassified Streptomyces]|uniref:hypothetical protein n=1 Tax=unclassified Streptomyces TaxID=2593676 RepID=UPI000361431B|nr:MULTISPECIES: hypothetical protein [unclassified Streptomyces]MYS32942.1 hypothetical protein [Streptomyces sp. SID4920]MYX64267.1 hypothetical protein [Streptomyces sp. SID8373]